MATIKMINGKYNSSNSLKNAIYYINRSDATTPDLVFSNCSSNNPNEIIREMMMNKEQWNKTRGTQLHHEVISFAPGEITPEEALAFGVEYACRMYGNRYQYDIAVHANTNNVHIHFINNSVSIDDGKKYNSRPEVLKKKREIIDQMCRDRGLAVCRKGYDANGHELLEGHLTSFDRATYETRTSQQKQQYSWKYRMYKAVNEAKSKSANQDEFREKLNAQGYNWEMRGKTLVFYEVENSQHRMRATTLSSTFHIDATTDGLDQAFIKNELERRLKHGQVLYVRLPPEIKQTKQVSLMTIRNNDALFSLLDCLPSGAARRDLYLIIETVEALHTLFRLIIDLIDKQYTAKLHTISLDEHKVNKSTYKGTKRDAYDAYCFDDYMSNSINPEGGVFNTWNTNVERTIERKRVIYKTPIDIDERER